MRIPVVMRQKMVAAVERGEAVGSVAARFEVSERGLRQILRQSRERGTLEPAKPGPKGPVKLTPEDDAKIHELIEADPGITLERIAAQLSVHVAPSTVHRRLQRLGISLKKNADRPRAVPPGRGRTASQLPHRAAIRRCGSLRVPR